MSSTQTSLTTAQLIALIAGSGAIATLTFKILHGAGRLWRSTVGSRADWRRRLYRLDQGLTVEYLESMLGIPTFRKGTPNGPRVLTFKTKYALVKAEINDNGTVVGYAVCATTRLKLDARELSFGQIDARLGKTTFGEVRGLPKELPPAIRGYIGASRTFYSELYYGARPGAYRSYAVANSWIGFRGGVFGVPFEPQDRHDDLPDQSVQVLLTPEAEAVEQARLAGVRAAAAKFVVNTLVVVSMGGNDSNLDIGSEEFHLWRPSGRVDRIRRWWRRLKNRRQLNRPFR